MTRNDPVLWEQGGTGTAGVVLMADVATGIKEGTFPRVDRLHMPAFVVG